MPHDDDQKCQEVGSSNSSSLVMSRTLDHNSNPWEWSSCSRHYVTQFIEWVANKTRSLTLYSGWTLDLKTLKLLKHDVHDNKKCNFVALHHVTWSFNFLLKKVYFLYTYSTQHCNIQDIFGILLSSLWLGCFQSWALAASFYLNGHLLILKGCLSYNRKCPAIQTT